MIKSRLSISIHILTLVSVNDLEWYSSDYIAGSLNMNPVLVRNEIANLKKSGLLESKEGKGGGVKLAKPADKITLAEIFNAVKGDHLFGFAKNEPNEKCPVGREIKERLDNLYCELDNGVVEILKKKRLSTFIESFKNLKAC